MPNTNKPVGQLKPVNNGIKPVGKLKPVQSNLSPVGQLKEGDVNTVLPKYTTPQDLAVDSSIELLKQKGGRNGSTVLDSEWDVLKDVLKDPRATKEQREKAILTIQGYDSKHDDNNTMYYNKLEDNGVYVPTALAYGEKPPRGYKVASVWGNQKEAEDDSWYTDLGKSLGNGVLGAAQGVVDLAQVGQTLVTGEESKYLNKLSNAAETLKFKKDNELETPILNTEGIDKWSDLLDKDRFDLSPKALWGAFNTAAESLTAFAGGTSGARQIFTNSPKAAIFTGSFATQLGDNLDNAEEAGLKGRDKAAVASAITAPMAALDVFWGLDGKLMSQLFRNEKKELLKNVVKSVEKDAAGNITENGFKQLAKQMTVGYTELAKRGTKEIVKDVLSEGGQEAAQDFSQKAGEQLWDKLTPDERGQFGTDAFSAKSFGDYINSFATGLVAGAPMAIGTQVLRNKNDEQSINAYERIKQGPKAVKALKVDLDNALKNNDINESEYNQANFKIDAYQKYHEETKDVNLKPEDERKAFELSFQIQGIKTEIPTNENEISKLDPISRAKVESKQKQAKELQNELNEIILKGEIKAEPVVASKIEEKIAKENDKIAAENAKVIGENAKASEKIIKNTSNKWQDLIDNSVSEKELDAVIDQMDKSGETTPDLVDYVGMKRAEFNKPKKEEIKTKFEVHEAPVKQPKFTEDKRTYDEIPDEEFNNHFTNARTIHRVLRKKLASLPSKEMIGKLFAHEYSYKKNGKVNNNRTIKVALEDGRIIKLASSKIREDSLLSSHTHTENIKEISTNENYRGEVPPVTVGVKVIDLNDTKGYKMPDGYKSNKKIIKVYNKENGKFISWVKETNTGNENAKDKAGKALYTAEEKDLMGHLKTINEDVSPESFELAKNTPIKPPISVTQRAEDATNKIVEEAKSARLTNQVSKTETVDATDKNSTESEEKAYSELVKKETKKKKRNPARDKKLVEYEQAEINRISKTVPKTLREAVLRYFAEKGRVTTKDFYTYIGKNDRANYNVHFWAINNDKKFSADTIAKKIWMEDFERSEETFDEQNVIEEIFDVLRENDKPTDIFQSLVKEHSKNNNEGMPDGYAEYLKEQDDIEKEFLDKEAEDEINARKQAEDELGDKFQKVSQRKGDINKVVNAIKKALPKINVEFTDKGEFSGKWNPTTNTITINTNYTALDTPIHEAGHILIDAMGYDNKVIQSAIKQLRNTPLYTETKERYSELNEQELDKEVLAEAIGREGADIFDKEADKSKFKQYLDYIFDWLKRKIGLEKNVAKSLAKQIISGIGTKNLEGNNGTESFQEKKIGFNKKINFIKTNVVAVVKGMESKLKSLNINFDKQIAKTGSTYFTFNKSGIDYSVRIANHSKAYSGAIKEESGISYTESYDGTDPELSIDASSMGLTSKEIFDLINETEKLITLSKEKSKEISNLISKNELLYNYNLKKDFISKYLEIIGEKPNELNQSFINEKYNNAKYSDSYQDYKKENDLKKENENKLDTSEFVAKNGVKINTGNKKNQYSWNYDYSSIPGMTGKNNRDKRNKLIDEAKQELLNKINEGVVYQKVKPGKKKNPIGVRALSFQQYAEEHGFDYEKETDKINEARALKDEAESDLKEAQLDGTDAEIEAAQLKFDDAKKNYAKVGKRSFEYAKYKKDFNEIQKIIKEKDIADYSIEELQDLISKLHSFDNKAAKSFRNEAMLKLATIAAKKQQEVYKGKESLIAKTKDISALQTKLLHHSHFTENNPDMQAVSLSFSNAVMDKIVDANTKKSTHEKLGLKVIQEENKRLGIVGSAANRFSSDSAKYFNWMENDKGELLTIDEAKAKGLSEAKINYLKFTRETIADYKGLLEENNFENTVMDSIRIDKGFMEAYKSEGLLPAFSYYLGGGASNLGKVRIVHNGQIKSYSEIEKEILAKADRKSFTSMAKALWDLLTANIQARRQLKKGYNVDEKENPLELKGEAEYSLNEKGQLVSKFDKPRAKDRGYSKDFYRAMNQFIDESAHAKHISKIIPLVDSVEYLNKNGYMDEGYAIKPNVAKWIEDWKKLQIFKEPHVNDPVLDAAIKAMRKLVASTTMWFNIPANVINVFMGNYSNWRQENGKTVALGNKRLFGGKGKDRSYGLDIIKKYNLVNQDYDSNATMKAGAILSNLGTWGTKVGEYQIQGSLGLGLLTEDEWNSFEYTKDKYGNDVLTIKPDSKISEADLKKRMSQIKNRITDIQGKYPDEDRRNIMKGEIGKAAFQFKVWMPDWFKERFSAKYINAYGVEKEGTLTKLLRVGIKEMWTDLNKGDFKNIYKNNPSFMSNLKGVMTIGTLMALAYQDDDDEKKKKGALNFQNVLSQVLFILDLEQDKYLVSNPVAALGKSKDLLSAFEAMVTLDEEALNKTKIVLPGNKALKIAEIVTE